MDFEGFDILFSNSKFCTCPPPIINTLASYYPDIEYPFEETQSINELTVGSLASKVDQLLSRHVKHGS